MPRPGTRQSRGYDADHDRVRRRYQRRMDTGEVYPCTRCHTPVDPTDWHLDHTDDRKTWLGPAHPRCNSQAGVQKRPSRKRDTEPHPGIT